MTTYITKLTIALPLLAACSHSYAAFFIAEAPPSEITEEAKAEHEPFPWFTGPLLTPSGHVVPTGHYNIEPYQFITTNYGLYDANWHTHSTPNIYTLNTQTFIQFGLPWKSDFTIVPAWSWNHRHGASHWVLNDMIFGLDFELLSDERGKWWPAIKLGLRATIPTGRYQKLHPKSKGTDIGGTGSWLPTVGLTMSRLFWWGGNYFFNPRLSAHYTIPNSVHVKNFNTYGGGHHTRGTVYPGQTLNVLFGFEISLSQNWAIAHDISYLHTNKTRFKGRKGATAGVPNQIGLPSSEQWSLAPAIEYNWTENYGVIAGAWFSFAGRNIPEFASAVIAVNVYH